MLKSQAILFKEKTIRLQYEKKSHVNEGQDMCIIKGHRGWLSGYSAGLVTERSRVRIPAGAAGEFSSPGVDFLC